MAVLSVTIPDSAVPRIRVAFGHTDPVTLLWVNATVAEVEAAVKGFLKSHVIDYETGQQAIATRETLSQEDWNA